MKALAASVFCLLVAGCATSPDGSSPTGFTSAYTPNRAVDPLTDFAPHRGTQITHSPDLVQEEAYYTSHGYVTLGTSSFVTSALIDRYDLVHLAESLQADVVLWAAADGDSPSPIPALENSHGTVASTKEPTAKPETAATPPAPRTGNSYRYTAVFFRRLR